MCAWSAPSNARWHSVQCHSRASNTCNASLQNWRRPKNCARSSAVAVSDMGADSGLERFGRRPWNCARSSARLRATFSRCIRDTLTRTMWREILVRARSWCSSEVSMRVVGVQQLCWVKRTIRGIGNVMFLICSQILSG